MTKIPQIPFNIFQLIMWETIVYTRQIEIGKEYENRNVVNNYNTALPR